MVALADFTSRRETLLHVLCVSGGADAGFGGDPGLRAAVVASTGALAALLDEPAVVSTFHAAGIDLSKRPLWNVGPEWRERVVSTDPLAVRVSAAVGGEAVACFVAGDLSVLHTDRTSLDDDPDGDGEPPRAEDASEPLEHGNGSTESETEVRGETGASVEADAATA